MRNVWMGIGFTVIWALAGWSQCVELSCLSLDGPSVAFKLCVQVAGATCSNVPKSPPAPSDTVRCSVSAGTSGTVDLIVNRTAAGGFEGQILLTGSVPGGWPTFTPVSKSGSGNMSLTAQYRFTVPPGTAGRSFELKFKVAADGCYGELILTVIVDVAGPSGPRLYGPYTGTTNENGRFSVPIRDLPNTQVGGTLTECTVRVLPRTPVTIYVAATAPVQPPPFGMSGFVWASYPVTPVAQQAPSISYILISAPGYPQVKVTQFFVLPITVGGTTHFMVDAGTVSLPAPTCQAQGGIGGTTDSAGNFRVNVGSGTTVSGRLTECTVKPLPNQTFTVVPKFSGGELDELKFVVPGYADTTVTKAVSVVHLGAMKYINLGDVCMVPRGPEREEPDAGITGKTDSNGAFTATIKPGTTVSGRLTVCTVTPIAEELYTVTPEYGADGAITAFRFSVSGYGEVTVTNFSKLSLSGLTWYDTGLVCLPLLCVVDCEAFCKGLLEEGEEIPEIGIFGITFSDRDRYTECSCREISMLFPETQEEKEAKRAYKEATGKEMVTLRDKLLAKCLMTPRVRPGDGITFQANYRPPCCVSYVEWFVRGEDRSRPLMLKRGETFTLTGEDTASLWKLFRKPGEEGTALILEVVCKVVWCDALSFQDSIQLVLGPKVAYPPDCSIGGG